MDFANFTGPAYQSLSKTAAVDRVVNYYCEWPEVPGEAKHGPSLYPRPAAKRFGSSPAESPGIARGKLAYNGFAYGVNGSAFVVLGDDGGMAQLGSVVDDGKPARLVANSSDTNAGNGQIAIASGGELYMYSGGVFTHIAKSADFLGAADVDFMDGYFIVIVPNSSKFQISGLNNGLSWSAANVAILLGQADHIRAIIADKEYFYLLGDQRSEIWYNSGNALFPFSIESGAFIEEGIAAVDSRVKADNGVFWLAQSERGGAYAVRTQGLTVRRISTHALEAAWANKDASRGKVYPTVADCVTYAFTWNGHTFIKFIFPTADASWVYDATESARVGFEVWTEDTFTDGSGKEHACVERDHCYVYGKHLVGSGGAEGAPGVVYQFDQFSYYDCDADAFDGYPITRDRVVRLPWNGNLRQFLDRLEFEIERGVGTAAGQGTDPQLLISISRDGGRTWGDERQVSMGAMGQYTKRVVANRLGSYRDGAIRVRVTDPVFAALIGAEHYIRQGAS
jgi:hypothetical protein